MPQLFLFSRTSRHRGSSLLLSAGQRMRRAAVAVVLLWLLTGWALQWW